MVRMLNNEDPRENDSKNLEWRNNLEINYPCLSNNQHFHQKYPMFQIMFRYSFLPIKGHVYPGVCVKKKPPCKEVTWLGKDGHTFGFLYISRKKCRMLRICNVSVLLPYCTPGKDSWNWYHPNQLTLHRRLDNKVVECLWLMFPHQENMLQKSFKCWKGMSLYNGLLPSHCWGSLICLR